jgi:hypothetical protein
VIERYDLDAALDAELECRAELRVRRRTKHLPSFPPRMSRSTPGHHIYCGRQDRIGPSRDDTAACASPQDPEGHQP